MLASASSTKHSSRKPPRKRGVSFLKLVLYTSISAPRVGSDCTHILNNVLELASASHKGHTKKSLTKFCKRFLVIHTYFYLFVVCCALSINNCLRASIYCIWFSSLASEPYSKVDRCRKQFAIIAQKIIWLQRKKLRKRQLKRPLRSADSCISATTRRSILSKEKSFVLGGGFFFL